MASHREQASLRSAQLKLQRAARHLEELRQRLIEFERGAGPDDPAFTLVDGIEHDSEGDWRVTRLKVLREPPDDLGPIAGDAMHNVRCSLDHLSTELWRLNGKDPPENGANLPILSRPLKGNDEAKIEANIKGMRDEHKDLIRDIQPYLKKGPYAVALATLSAFENRDKHAAVHPVFVAAREALFAKFESRISFQGTDQDETPHVSRLTCGVDLHDGDEVGRTQPVTGSVHAHIAVRVGFGDPPVSLKDLAEIHELVVGLIAGFDREFSQPVFAANQ